MKTVPNHSGTIASMQPGDTTADQNLESALQDALANPVPTEQATKDEPAKEKTIDDLGLSEEQLTEIKRIKQTEIDTVNNHWKQTKKEQNKELGRLRKIEKTILELEQEETTLKKQEADNQYDTEKRIEIGSQRLTVNKEKQLAQKELLQARTSQMVPDLDLLIKEGYLVSEIKSFAKTKGLVLTDAQIDNALEGIKSTPEQAVLLASGARKAKQIAELTDKNKRIVTDTNDLTKKVTIASESRLISNTRKATSKYTHSDIVNMSSEQREVLIQRGRENGAFAKK